MADYLRVAIDGPAGVGKSTIGEKLARRLNCLYVDSGAFYRTLAAVALDQRIAPDDAAALEALAQRIAIVIAPPTNAQAAEGHQYTVLVDGADITAKLRTPAVEASVSLASSHPAVRAALIERMREMGGRQCIVMVGRDIGSVVLPDAELKVFLTTSIDERAKRRHRDLTLQYGAAGPSLESVRDAIARRDALDAPHMQVAPGALTFNNDHLEADDVVGLILTVLGERGLIGGAH